MSVAERNPYTGPQYKRFEVVNLYETNHRVMSTFCNDWKVLFDQNAHKGIVKRYINVGNFFELENALCNYM